MIFSLGACTLAINQDDSAKIAGRTYVITGASSGFGRGVAEKLGASHANVVLAARRTNVLSEVANEVEAAGGHALVVTTDVSKPEDVRRLADKTIQAFGGFDVWINDAGVGAIGRFEDIPVEDHARLVDVNYKGVLYGSHAAMRQFNQQGYGTLINLGSVESEVPLAYHASYAGTKAAILAFDQALNQEIRLRDKDDDIHVVTIMPYAVDTPFWEHAANYSGGTARMGSMDDPDKVVDTIIFSSLYSNDKMPVGWKALATNTAHYILPTFTESRAADAIHQYQIETAPPQAPTSGSLHRPMQSGTGVSGGVRERMKREDEQMDN